MDNLEIEKLFYADKNYSEVKERLKNSFDHRSFNLLGKLELWQGNTNEAFAYFNKSQNIFGCAYCKFLSGNLKEAAVLLNLINNSSSAVNWLLCLINVLENKYEVHPTYFQIRNFYEQDLSMLFFYNKKSYIEKIIKENSYFERYNREIYKYSARVLLNNNNIIAAEIYLKKSLNIFYKDPETHYMLGELYLTRNEIQKAKQEFMKSEEVNGGYAPAKNKLIKLIV